MADNITPTNELTENKPTAFELIEKLVDAIVNPQGEVEAVRLADVTPQQIREGIKAIIQEVFDETFEPNDDAEEDTDDDR